MIEEYLRFTAENGNAARMLVRRERIKYSGNIKMHVAYQLKMKDGDWATFDIVEKTRKRGDVTKPMRQRFIKMAKILPDLKLKPTKYSKVQIENLQRLFDTDANFPKYIRIEFENFEN